MEKLKSSFSVPIWNAPTRCTVTDEAAVRNGLKSLYLCFEEGINPLVDPYG